MKFGYFTALNLAYLTNKITLNFYLEALNKHQIQLYNFEMNKLINYTKLK